ncbi:hypothetical protein T439DRAFT_324651 [Meredithblackwellia eburnea MCA 4105]
MGGGLLFGVLFIALILAAVGFIAVPKGANQVVIRTGVLLVVSCCYIMWAITYLAQLHPLIKPRRADLRVPKYEPNDY